jgi:hypothetical protein
MEACAACGGIGYGSRGPNGYVEGGPCKSCNPQGDGRYLPAPPEQKSTAEVIEEGSDGNLRSRSVPWQDGEITAHHPHPDNERG